MAEIDPDPGVFNNLKQGAPPFYAIAISVIVFILSVIAFIVKRQRRRAQQANHTSNRNHPATAERDHPPPGSPVQDKGDASPTHNPTNGPQIPPSVHIV